MLTLVVAVGLALAAIALIMLFVARTIVRVPPDKVVILTGKQREIFDRETGQRRVVGYRVITGGSAFRIPVFERADHLSLAEMSIHSELDGLRDIDGRSSTISLLVNCRIAPEAHKLDRAVTRFLTMDLPDIEQIVETTIESRIINLFPTVDSSDAAAWPESAIRIEQAIRADLDMLGLSVDNLIFGGPPALGATLATANGHAAGPDR